MSDFKCLGCGHEIHKANGCVSFVDDGVGIGRVCKCIWSHFMNEFQRASPDARVKMQAEGTEIPTPDKLSWIDIQREALHCTMLHQLVANEKASSNLRYTREQLMIWTLLWFSRSRRNSINSEINRMMNEQPKHFPVSPSHTCTYACAGTDCEKVVGPSQPMPTHRGTKPIWESVIEDMRSRDEFGRRKYGTPLQAFNGRKALQDFYEELLDAVVYAKQEIIEREEFQKDSARTLQIEGAEYSTHHWRDITSVHDVTLEYQRFLCDAPHNCGSVMLVKAKESLSQVDPLTALTALRELLEHHGCLNPGCEGCVGARNVLGDKPNE